MCRRLTETILVLALLVGAARGQEASSPDEQVAAYLDALALDDLLGAQLRERLARAGENERVQIAERLGRLYTRQLAGAKSDEQRGEIERRSRALLEAIPEGRLFDLRISLAIALYLPSEEIAERARLAMATDEEIARAIENLGGVRDILSEVSGASEREVVILERRERAASESVRREAKDELVEARRVRSLSHYYSGWAGYYAAMLEGDSDGAAQATRHFGFLLDSTEQRPTIERLPKRLLRYEHVSRAAIGVALCFALEQRHADAVRWVDELAQAPELAPEAIDQLRAATMVVYAGASSWTELHSLISQRRRAPSGAAALPEGEARLLAVLALDATQSGSLSPSSERQATTLAKIAVGDLSASGSVDHVLDLASRFEDLPIGDDGFIFRYAQGLMRYREARERHGARGQDNSRPASDQAVLREYAGAAETLTLALESADARRYPTQRDECRLRLGLSLFYAGELELAARELQKASESETQSVRDEGEWMRVVALDTAVEGGDESLRAARDEAAGEYLRLHPRSSRAGLLVMRLADAEVVGDAQAAEILSSVPPDAPYAGAAQRLLSRLLYRLYRAAPADDRNEAAVRFVSVAAPLNTEDERAALEGGAELSEQAAQALYVRARQVLDAVLGVEVIDLSIARRTLDALERVAASRGENLDKLREELDFRRLQIALRQEDTSSVEAIITRLRATGGRFADAADRLMYRRALIAWAAPPRRSDTARELVRHGRRLVDTLLESDPEIGREATRSVLDTVSDAASFLAQGEDDAEMLAYAVELDTAMLGAGVQTIKLLRRVARLSEQSGDAASATDAWLRLMSGVNDGEVAWYEARYHSIRLMLLTDPARARVAIDQYRVLHPDAAPPPWEQRLRELEAQIRLTPGGGG